MASKYDGLAMAEVLLVNETGAFDEKLKECYAPNPEIRQQFLDIMESTVRNKISFAQADAQVEKLFSDQPELYQEYHKKATSRYLDLAASPAPESQSKTLEEANTFRKKVEEIYSNSPETYQAFVDAVGSVHREHVPISQVNEQIKQLFVAHPELYHEFDERFTTKTYVAKDAE